MKVAIAGYSGLIGHYLLDRLKADPGISEIRALGRSTPAAHLKIRFFKTDFQDISALKTVLADCDALFCCLGTTIKTAGSKEAFRRVDYTYVVNLAEAGAQAGVEQFAVVSAIGADPESGVFYSKVKGEMQEAVLKSGISKVYLFQPSLLLGDREEFRLGEKIGGFFMRAVSPLMIGGLKKYKPIKASTVAKAMHAAVKGQVQTGTLGFAEMGGLVN